MKRILILITFLTLVACKTTPTNNVATSTPKASQSEFIKTEGAGFLLKAGKPMYAMTYQIIKSLPQNTSLKIYFENPEDSNMPFSKVVIADSDKLLVRSEPLAAIKNNNNYKVVLEVIQNSKVISSHTQYVRFSMPENVLNQLGVNLID